LIFWSFATFFGLTIFWSGAKQRFCYTESMSVLDQNGRIYALGFLARWQLTSHALYYKIPYSRASLLQETAKKKVPDQLLDCRKGDLWRTWMIPNLFEYESKWFPWSSRINFIPFRIFRGPLFHKPVTGQELFFAVSYSKPALVVRIGLRGRSLTTLTKRGR